MCCDTATQGRTRWPGATSPSPSPTAAIPVADGLEIYPRSTWAGTDRPARGELLPEEVRFLLVHHTAGPSEYSEDGAIAEMQGVYRFHTGPERGWPDVCYNFFVDRFGRVFEARTGSLDGPVLADATGGSQGFAQLVCLLGDFTDQMPSPQALDALTRTLAWLAGRHRIAIGPDVSTSFVSRGSNRWPEGVEVVTNTIAAHRDMSQTACPGDAFYPYVTSRLRTDVGALAPPVGTPISAASVTSTPATITPAASTPATPPGATPDMSVGGQTTAPVDVASAESSNRGPDTTAAEAMAPRNQSGPNLLLGGLASVGVAGAAAGLVWVLRRRIENQSAQR